MNAAAVVTIIAAVLAVAAIAVYLISVAVVLRQINSRLDGVIGAVGKIIDATRPVGPVVASISTDLGAAQGVLEHLLERKGVAVAPAAAPARTEQARELSSAEAPPEAAEPTWELSAPSTASGQFAAPAEVEQAPEPARSAEAPWPAEVPSLAEAPPQTQAPPDTTWELQSRPLAVEEESEVVWELQSRPPAAE